MAVIFRLFKLGLDLDYQESYRQVGQANLRQSQLREPGTLAMYVNHAVEDFSEQFVLEIYQDDAAYQEHTLSEHFKAFAALAGQALTSREVTQLHPRKLLKKSPALSSFEKEPKWCIRLAEVTVKSGSEEDFADVVLPEMEISMRVESGLLVMLAGQDQTNPQKWYFYEIYRDENAYESHRQTQHFKDYIAESQEMVESKILHALSGDFLFNRAD
ncbi:putative quinol monooxygenase [Streptococcus saliviloxodontae]|uniref:Quinol monooxygenase YgiN n=1 Tax=Streptococcus saliviloxodontae TaxID=1349416 RepID=A0ABS2PNF8_9STRE|nr:antibiotic biosynthesis monooxygenase [Streptococcus saliviloxodontae]MBM7636822.1 quinol monooxygenase YgiN [Streptococcus saliviloxodontae]